MSYREVICEYKSQEGCTKSPAFKCIDRCSGKEIFCCKNCAEWLCEECPGPTYYCESLSLGSKTPVWMTSFGGHSCWV